VRLAFGWYEFLTPGWFPRFLFLDSPDKRHVKRTEGKNSASRNNNKGGKPLYREALPPFVRCAMAEHVCLLGSIAVTFGTLGKPFDRRGLWKSEIRSLSLHFQYFLLPA